MKKIKWTEKQIKFLKENYNKLSYEKLGLKLNKTRVAVAQKIYRLGLKRTFALKAEKNKSTIVNYFNNGMYIQDIAKKVNMSRRHVGEKLKEWGYSRDYTINKNHHCWKGFGEISGAFWSNLECQAKKRNLIFDIDIEYVWKLFLNQNRLCSLSGIELKFSKIQKDKSQQTASLDRIDSSKGYIKDNVQWVHKTINNMKSCMSDKDFIDFCNKVSSYNDKSQDAN